MMSGAYLFILAGENYTYQTNVAIGNVAENVAGATLWFLAQQEPIDGLQNNLIFNVSGAPYINVSGNNNATVTINLPASLTATFLQSNAARWALRCRSANNEVYTLDRGQLAIEPSLG